MCFCVHVHAGVCSPAPVLMFDEGLRFEEGGVLWLFMPQCTLFGFTHRRMTCELQRVAGMCVYLCEEGAWWEGRGSNKRFSSSGCIVVVITNVSI